jgi:hypothetical protein
MGDMLDADKLLVITRLLVEEQTDLMATSVINNSILVGLGVRV